MFDDIVRRCCYCELEFGVKKIPETSHGICLRHCLEQLKEMGMDKDEFLNREPREFCPDYSQVFDG